MWEANKEAAYKGNPHTTWTEGSHCKYNQQHPSDQIVVYLKIKQEVQMRFYKHVEVISSITCNLSARNVHEKFLLCWPVPRLRASRRPVHRRRLER
jgi:hypothetical protein